MLAIADSVVVPTGLQMRTASDGKIEVDVRIDGIAAGIAAQTETVCKLAGEAKSAEFGGDPWQAREELWNAGASSAICKLSMLPSQLSSTAEFVREGLSQNADWSFADALNRTCLAANRCHRLHTDRRFHFIAQGLPRILPVEQRLY